MSDLTKQLEVALKFTDTGINWNKSFRNGMQHEKDRLAPLHASLLKCVECDCGLQKELDEIVGQG